MNPSNNNINQLIDLLQANSLILTPNQRLSRSLAKSLDKVYASTQSSWVSPTVLPLNTWLLQLIDAQRMLGTMPLKPMAQPLEEIEVWQSILEADDSVMVRSKALAKLARTAYQTIGEWQLDIEQHSFEFNADEDTKHFLMWCRQYKRQQKSLPFVNQTDALSQLSKLQEAIENHVVLVGFQSIPPLQQSIINKAASQDVFSWQACESQQSVFTASDTNHELQQMALWAHATHKAKPTETIALCVPDLNQSKARVLAALDEVFQPDAALPSHDRSDQHYDVSAGTSLADTGLGRVLLDCLTAMKRELPLPAWQALLSSPFIAAGDNSLATVAQLKKYPIPQAKLGSLAIWLGPQSPLEPIYQFSKSITKARSLGEWVLVFKDVLQLWQWAGARTLSSHEYQQHQLCLQSLQQFSVLRLSAKSISFNKAVELFTELITQQVFHAQTPATAISVLGSLEAAGQVFDHLWVSGMQDTQWPPKLAPNPFIPPAMQHSLAMPRGSTEREFDYAHSLLNGFAKSANNVVFSYTEQSDDVAVALTRLLELDESAGKQQGVEVSPNPAALALVDIIDTDVALNEGSREVAATTLRDQSQCPFKAFASRRLALKAPLTRSEGLSAADRGSLLHRALEAFFTQYQSSAALADTSAEALMASYQAAASLAINSFPVKKKRLYKPALFELEQWRLEILIKEWVESGEDRSQPFEIQALEYEQTIQLAGLNVNMRLDRVDIVNRQWFIIDYKSSAATSHNWQTERLLDPQLPLYAVALADNKVCGIAVAHVRPNESALKSLANSQSGIKKPIEDDFFTQLIEQWRAQMHTLADEYVSGVASVEPIRPSVCDYCDYSSVCRIYETGQANVS